MFGAYLRENDSDIPGFARKLTAGFGQPNGHIGNIPFAGKHVVCKQVAVTFPFHRSIGLPAVLLWVGHVLSFVRKCGKKGATNCYYFVSKPVDFKRAVNIQIG